MFLEHPRTGVLWDCFSAIPLCSVCGKLSRGQLRAIVHW